ncbi:MAG: hypothetical protein AAGA65_09155 [Actinomycetota bacterium]
MPTTLYPASMRPVSNRIDRGRSGRITSSDWVTVGNWSDTPPSNNRFSLQVEALFDMTDTATAGEVRFVAVDANGAVFASEAETIPSKGRYRTKWVEVKPQGTVPVVYSIELQARRTGGTGALIDVALQPNWESGPETNVQECNPLAVAGENSNWTDGPGTRANPIQGTGHSLLFIAVAPGPGFDDLNGADGAWVDPPGAMQIADYEVQDASAQFVQRVRMWFMPVEDGAVNYTFGYAAPGSWPADQLTQSTAVIGFDGSAPAATVFGPMVDTLAAMPYPVGPASTGFLALAVATGQNDDEIQGLPDGGGWTEELNNSAEPSVDRRTLAVFSKATTGETSVDPGLQAWSATTAAHAQWVVMIPCGTGGTAPSTFQQIPSADLSYEVDPVNSDTWSPSRTNLQLMNAGSGWNPGQTTTGFTTGWSSEPGYDLSWNGAGNEISSWPMDNGETRRLWLGTVAGGIPALKGAAQYRPGASNYNSANDINGVNEQTTYPGADRILQGGTRVLHYSDIDGHVRVGPGAEEWIWYFAFATERWMGAMDNTTCPFDFHSPNLPGGGLTSPLLTFIREGQIRFFTRDGQTSDGGVPVPPVTGNNDLGTTQLHWEDLEPFDVPQGFIVHAKLDPSTTDRFVNIYKIDAAGNQTTLLESTAKVGYWYSDDSAGSGQFYFLNQMYSFPAFTDTADANAGVVENWDTDPARVGPDPTVREFNIIRAGARKAPSWTVADAANDIRKKFLL